MSTYSVNELENLAAKAARGAGSGTAQAMHFGRACTFHLAAGRDPAALLNALQNLPEGPIQFWPIHRPNPETELDHSYAEALAAPAHRPPLPARLSCPHHLWQRLHYLAQKTYVPASEASRQAGAGAGLTDND